MEQAFRRGLAAFRWGAWIWIAVTLVIYWNTDYLRHHWVALALVLLALVFTVLQTALVAPTLRLQNRRVVAAGELITGYAIMTLDGYVRRSGVVFENGPTLGSWWPVVGLMSAATYMPVWAAGLCGLGYGVARLVSTWLNGIRPSLLTGGEILSIVDTGVFSALAAMSVSGLMKLLRNAESEVSLARARDEIARTLHDGVLQTLAVVERRSDDEALSRLAREQELELRRFLFEQDAATPESEELVGELMKASARFEQLFDGQINLVLAPDLPKMDRSKVHTIVGVITEALTNAGKHGSAKLVTVYIEPEDSKIFFSIKDNGSGFDINTITERVGLKQSIKGRVQESGGRVEIKSEVGQGTEVLVWLP